MKTPYIYHIDPRIELISDFIDHDTCEHFIRIATTKLHRSRVMDEEQGGSKVTDARTSEHCWIKVDEDSVVSEVAQKIATLTHQPLKNAENYQLVHYGIGQEYKPHYDTFDLNGIAGQKAHERGGQRLVTAILYLNEVTQGGNTNFPKIGLEVEPVKGSLLIFHNCLNDTATRHPKSLHGGMPVLAGEKWIVNLWFRESVFK